STSESLTTARQSAATRHPGTVAASPLARSGTTSQQTVIRAPRSAAARLRPISPQPMMAIRGVWLRLNRQLYDQDAVTAAPDPRGCSAETPGSAPLLRESSAAASIPGHASGRNPER